MRRHHLLTQRGFDKIVKPSEHADLVLDTENLLGPEQGTSDGGLDLDAPWRRTRVRIILG